MAIMNDTMLMAGFGTRGIMPMMLTVTAQLVLMSKKQVRYSHG
jgi:hypothetical protein